LTIAIAFTSCEDKATEATTSNAEAAAMSTNTSQKYTANVVESSME
jgi:hypothetical protein